MDIDQQQAVTYLPDLEANDMAHSRKRKRDRVWKYARATPLQLVGGEHQKYVDQGDKTPRYMIYGQAHYNCVIYDHRAKEEETASGGGSGIGRQDEERKHCAKEHITEPQGESRTRKGKKSKEDGGEQERGIKETTHVCMTQRRKRHGRDTTTTTRDKKNTNDERGTQRSTNTRETI